MSNILDIKHSTQEYTLFHLPFERASWVVMLLDKASSARHTVMKNLQMLHILTRKRMSCDQLRRWRQALATPGYTSLLLRKKLKDKQDPD